MHSSRLEPNQNNGHSPYALAAVCEARHDAIDQMLADIRDTLGDLRDVPSQIAELRGEVRGLARALEMASCDDVTAARVDDLRVNESEKRAHARSFALLVAGAVATLAVRWLGTRLGLPW